MITISRKNNDVMTKNTIIRIIKSIASLIIILLEREKEIVGEVWTCLGTNTISETELH